jgi:hypothetical protein
LQVEQQPRVVSSQEQLISTLSHQQINTCPSPDTVLCPHA